MLRVVIDTPVLVAGFLGPDYSPAHALLEAHREGEFELVTSPRLFAELAAVLRAPAFERQAGDARGERFCRQLASSMLFAGEPYDLPRVSSARQHDQLIAVARAGGAKLIVSSDDGLLRSFARDLTIATPEEFLAGLDRMQQLRLRAS